ncbi:hypothetical protein D3C87_1399210 [compost metagenome]
MVNISIGGLHETSVDPKIIFAVALKSKASGIILCHNHPSEELQPSQEDINLTKRLKEVGKLLDTSILDHLIISKEGFYSFKEEGLM